MRLFGGAPFEELLEDARRRHRQLRHPDSDRPIDGVSERRRRRHDRNLADAADAELLLRAYARWGERAPEHLLGDFAFALWDGRRHTLFCARDHFGVKPFYYHHAPGRLFAFASEIKGLLALAEVPRRLNETRVADYLVPLLEDKDITFYDGIVRLPPAHRLTVSRDGVRIAPYWALDPEREIRLKSDDEYAEAFREIFTEAVRCRLRSAVPVGALLSGGLDSSSIVCVARRLLAADGGGRLHTFSAIFPDVPECDEREYIAAVVAGGGVAPHYVRGDELSPLEQLDAMLAQQDEPFYAPNLFLHAGLYREAAGAGIRVILDGLDGDTTVSHGLGYLHELARRGRWVRLAREVHALAARLDRPATAIWRSQILAAFLPSVARRAWARVRGRHARGRSAAHLVRAEFACRVALADRMAGAQARWRLPWRTERQEHHCRLVTGLIPFVLEVADRCAAAYALEPRYAFFDKRLAELCLALPSVQKLRRGWTRFVLRRAMEGTVPSAVQWRAGKADLGPNFTRRLSVSLPPQLTSALCDPGAAVREYVDVAAALDALGTDSLSAWKLLTLARWLDIRERTHPVTGGNPHEHRIPGSHDLAAAGRRAHTGPVRAP